MRAHEFTDQGAAGIVLYAQDTGRYGLQQRSDRINDGGLWAAWGGGREPGESLEQCARRELREESGYTGPIKLKRLGENARYVTFLGVVPHEFKPRADDEWQDYCWVEAGDWPNPIHPGTAAALKNIPVDEGLKSKLAGAALAGGMALGAGGANAMDWKDAAMTGAMFVPGIGQAVKAYNVGKSLYQAGTAAKQYRDASRDLDALAAQQKAQPKQVSTVAYDPNNTDKFEPIDEAFDQPYDIRWSQGDHGDYDAYAELDDGTGLEIAFLDQQHNSWMVDFFRDNSTEITGEGDAYRVFATVLTAIREFIVKQQPDKLNFSAEKQDDPKGSRASLYDRMIQRYITGTGYTLSKENYPDGAVYTLTKTQQGVKEAEDQINELGNAPAEYKPNRKRKRSLFHATVDGNWVDVFFDRSEFNDTLHITFAVNGDYETPSQPTSASKSTVRILSTVLNIVKQRLPEYMTKARPPAVSFTAKGDNRAGLYRKYFVPVIQNILGPKWAHEEYPSMGMTVFHWKPVKKQDMAENFADGRNPQDKGDSKSYGVPTKASVSTLRKVAKQGGRKGQLAHWMANMKAGRAKARKK